MSTIDRRASRAANDDAQLGLGDLRERETADDDTPDCGHMPEYQTPEGCLRCDDPLRDPEEREANRELVRDSAGGLLR